MTASIGVFDSGIGGLSVLRALRAELPRERFVYLADGAHAPYGERGVAYVRTRSLAIAAHLIAEHHIKALVVACNTATAAAIGVLRLAHPHLPIVGVEPALKPAMAHTRNGRIGVMATRGTLESARFAQLRAAVPPEIDVVLQPCDGLAHAIERCTVEPEACAQINALCQRYTQALGAIDTLVLGCTHYVFAQEPLRALLGPAVALIDTGEPVARQTRRLLERAQALTTHGGDLRLFTTGDLAVLQAAAARWLHVPASACGVAHVPG